MLFSRLVVKKRRQPLQSISHEVGPQSRALRNMGHPFQDVGALTLPTTSRWPPTGQPILAQLQSSLSSTLYQSGVKTMIPSPSTSIFPFILPWLLSPGIRKLLMRITSGLQESTLILASQSPQGNHKLSYPGNYPSNSHPRRNPGIHQLKVPIRTTRSSST